MESNAMDITQLLTNYGPVGICIMYFLKKEIQWEAEKAACTQKYESLLKNVIKGAADLTAKIDAISDALNKGEKSQ